MRLLLKIGLAPKKPTPPQVDLAAASTEDGASVRWFNGSLDLKTAIAAASLLLVFVGSHVDTSSKLASMAADAKQIRADVDRLQRVEETKVSKADYDRTLQQQQMVMGALERGEQQIYQLLVESRVQVQRP